MTLGQGLVVGSAAGGDLGIGTVNATGVYINGVAVGAGGGTPPGGSAGQVQFNAGGTGFGGFTVSGDATLNTATGVLTLAAVNANAGIFQGLTINAKGLVTAAANQNYLTGNQTVTLSGDVTGSGSTAIITTLPTVNANVGTFQGLTVNAKGLVTSAVNQNYATTAALSGYLPLGGGAISGTAPGSLVIGAPPAGSLGAGTLNVANLIQVNANTATLPAAPAGTLLRVANLNGVETRILFDTFGSGIAGNVTVRKANGTASAPSALLNNDVMGQFAFFGFGATAYSASNRAAIQGRAVENWNDTAQGTYLNFITTPPGTVTPLQAMTLGRGLVVGSAAGGDLGTGTINATGLYIGGVAVSAGAVTFPGGTPGQVQFNSAGTLGGFTVTGDATLDTGSGALTLATVNANVGTFQGLTVNAKGLVTAAANQNYAPLASPGLTGTPTAPTAPFGTSTIQIATTAFVATNYAPLASPALTGTPTAPTAAAVTNTTQLATTAFVKAQGYLTGNQTVTLSGDVGGSGATAIITALATVNANVGFFQGIQVNAKGLVISASNQNYATTAALAGYLPLGGGAISGTAPGSLVIGAPVGGSLGPATLNTAGLIQVNMNAATLPAAPAGTLLRVANADGQATRILFDTFGAGVSGNVTVRKANGTAGTPTALLNNDAIGQFAFFGYGATGYSASNRAAIQGRAVENWSDAAQGTYLNFITTPPGSVTPAQTMTLGQGLVIGSPTGGDLGPGTVNAPGIYVNGVAVSAGGNLAGGATGQVQYNSAGGFGGFTVAGDATLNTATGLLTLAAVNSNIGTFQGLTVNAKGLITAAANQGYLTGNQTVTLSGDVVGSGATAIPTTLASVNANVGTFQGLTVNAKGLVTAAANQNYAPLASPGLIGTPTAPTAPFGTSTIQIATTAFVATNYAPLASPALTGTPTAPTATAVTNTTQIATTAYVKSQGYISGNQTVTLSGDVGGSGTTAILATLASVNANVGTFQGLQINAKGLITAAANQNYATTAALSSYVPLAGGTMSGLLAISQNAAALPAVPSGTLLRLGGADNATTRLLLDAFGSGVAGNTTVRKANGTAAAPSPLLNNDAMGQYAFFGYGATGYSASNRAAMQGRAIENWSDTAQGTVINFITTPPGTVTPTQMMTLGQGLVVGSPPDGDLGSATHNQAGLLQVNMNTAALPAPLAGTGIRLAGADTVVPRSVVDAYGNQGRIDMRRTDGTCLTPTGIVNNDQLGTLGWFGWLPAPTSAMSGARAGVAAVALETWSATNQGAGLSFSTTPVGSASILIGAMSLDGSGNLTVLGGTATKPGGGSWAAPSSRAVKRNIRNYDRGLEALAKLRPVSFEYNGRGGTIADGKTYHGLVAEAVADIMPELLTHSVTRRYIAKGEDEIDSRDSPGLLLDPSALTYALLNAVCELAARLQRLEEV
jgi:hypothetical protein